jgi:hypothetical protein
MMDCSVREEEKTPEAGPASMLMIDVDGGKDGHFSKEMCQVHHHPCGTERTTTHTPAHSMWTTNLKVRRKAT